MLVGRDAFILGFLDCVARPKPWTARLPAGINFGSKDPDFAWSIYSDFDGIVIDSRDHNVNAIANDDCLR